MTQPTRLTATLILALLAASGVFAQQAEPPATATGLPIEAEPAAVATETVVEQPAGTETEASSPYASRQRFEMLIDRHPPELARVLALDPSLLSNEPFLARYPEIAQFVAANPEVRRNPHYFVRQFDFEPRRERGPMEEIIEALSIAFVFGLTAFALAWIVRTIIEQKRWNRLSRTQAEVHNKILDRFGSSEELLAYIKTPAGSKFLESAPIPLHTEPARQQTHVPMSRAMWSIQVGVIVAAAGLGMLLVSLRSDPETARELFAMGVIAFFIGAGFIGSAAVSISMSRRMGLWPEKGAEPGAAIDDSGAVR
jgi:hypothetical protein